MIRLVARAVLWLALTAVLVVAGAHAVYYLLNWEWNRAALASTAFVAALVLAATTLLLGRLARVERRLDLVLAAHEAAPPTAIDPAASDVGAEPRPDFPWLAGAPALVLGVLAVAPEPAARDAVFIPVFLAAGLVVSALAAAIERVAAFVQGRRVPADRHVVARQLIRQQPRWTLWVVPAVGAVVITLTVGGLYLGAHYWSRPIGPGVTTMTVEVDSRGPTAEPREVVETLGRFCALDTGTGIAVVDVAPGPTGSTLLRLEPLLDDDAQKRYIGCLEDATLEWHRLTVTGTTLDPA